MGVDLALRGKLQIHFRCNYFKVSSFNVNESVFFSTCHILERDKKQLVFLLKFISS